MESLNDLNFKPDDPDTDRCDAQKLDAANPGAPVQKFDPPPVQKLDAPVPKSEENAPSELMTLMNLSQGIISHDLSAFIHGLACARERMSENEWKRFMSLVNREFNLWNPHAQIKGTTLTSGKNPQLVLLVSAKSKDLWGMRCVKASQVHEALTIGQTSF